MTCCPEHPGVELREEWHGAGRTGFCIKCPQNYQLCTNTLHMTICSKIKGHTGPHVSKRGDSWETLQ